MTSFLTALSLLAHTVFGCCWHHEHPSVPAPANVAATAMVSGQMHACPCSHHHGDQEPTAPVHDEDPCDQGPCDEDRCVTTFRDSAPGPWVDGALAAVAADVAPLADSSCLSPVALPVPLAIDHPLRTHLVLQVLLI